ncbi:MAG: biotin--[acetyl-CoA-carboxylase] ligase [Dokdonella sp.]
MPDQQVTQSEILSELASGATLSGSALAGRLGVTRTAVWKHIERLRAAGVSVQAQAGSGYRLAAPIDLLDHDAILAAMGAEHRRSLGELGVHWEIDSTNSELLRRASSDPRDRLACIAERQSAGRGRHGRTWCAPLGGGLMLSLLKRFDMSMAALSGLSLAVGVAVVRAIVDSGIAGAGVKWPNDIVDGNRKLAGVLIELGGDALGPCFAVIGIGLNIRMSVEFSASIDQPCVDLATLAGAELPSRNIIAGRVLARLLEASDVFASDGFAAFAPEYVAVDALRGRPIRIVSASGERSGVACGIDARGALRVRGNADEFRVDSGEVSVRPI